MLRNAWFALALAFFANASAAPSERWEQLWNGRDTSGWEHVGAGEFLIEDGALKATGPKGKLGLFWYTREKLGNCVLRVVYKGARDAANSGVYIRIPEKPMEPGMPVRRAHEIQIAGRHTGEIYALTRVEVSPSPAKPAEEWNTLEITMDGPRTIVYLNGVKVTDYTEGDAEPRQENMKGLRPEYGYIGLQNHDDDVLWFKEVALRRLKK